MKDRHPGKKTSRSKRFASNGAKFTEVAQQSVASPAASSRQILSITSAAVNALAEPKRMDVVDINPRKRSLRDDGVSRHFAASSRTVVPHSDTLTFDIDGDTLSLDSSSTSSIPAAEKAILNISNDSSSNSLRCGDWQDKPGFTDHNSSSSSRDLSFSGTQKVRIPSRLLREIKSPVERTVTFDQTHEARGQGNKDETHPEATPLVVRHSNGPSAWVLTTANTLPTFTEHYSTVSHDTRGKQPRTSIPVSMTTDTVDSSMAGQDVLKTYGESTRQMGSPGLPHGQGVLNTDGQPTRETGSSCLPHDRPWNKDVTHPTVAELLSQPGVGSFPPSNSGVQKKKAVGGGLYQGDPVSGGMIPIDTATGTVRTKMFGLSDKEKTLKESFLKRQERKGPVKRFVQPTVVAQPKQDETEEIEDKSKKDGNSSVVTAAAIAAAAASAATAPFLQIQHGLESQISALVSNLQVLQQHHCTAQEQRQRDQETLIQEQIQSRLTRLEEAQKQLLELQTRHVTPVRTHLPARDSTGPVGRANPSDLSRGFDSQRLAQADSTHITDHCAGDLLTYRTAARNTYSPVADCRAGGMPSRDTAVQYSSASPFDPQPVSATSVYSRTVPHSRAEPDQTDSVAKYKLVKNMKTQTSPQESITSQESHLQTPLPRKRPPVPMSRHARPKSRSSGSRSRHQEQEKRVHFDEPVRDFTPRASTCNERMSDKGRRLLEEILGPHPTPPSEERSTYIRPPSAPPQDYRRAPRSEHIQHHRPVFSDATQGLDPRPLQPETAAVIDDLGKIRTELRSVLTETERLKDDMAAQKRFLDIRDHDADKMAHTDPSPLDAYLVDRYGPQPVQRFDKSALLGSSVNASAVRHYADAEQILRDVQARRETLEANLTAILRQREEKDLYALVDHLPQSEGIIDDTIRIRKEVDIKISKITTALQREIEQETGESQAKQEKRVPDAGVSKRKPVRPVKPVPGNVLKSSVTATVKRTGLKKASGKENIPEKKVVKKPKVTRTQSTPKPSSTKQPAVSAAYLASVYGREAYYPRRTTSKAPYLHFQSPINPKTAAVTAGILGPGIRVQPQVQEVVALPTKREYTESCGGDKDRHFRVPKDKSRYYFHPTVDVSRAVAGKGDVRVAVPVEGQLVPMAIPLGRPKTNPALRLPIATQPDPPVTSDPEATSISESLSEGPPVSSPHPRHQSSVPAKQPARSNVAVILIRGKDMEQNEGNGYSRQHRKSPLKKKSGASLGVQVLPAVDIDSYTDTSESFETPTREPRIAEITEPVTRPADSEYDEFRSYLAVRDTGVQSTPVAEVSEDDEERHEIPTPENVLSLQGHPDEAENRPYNGPPFPPQHPVLPSNLPSGGVIEADTRQEEALQQRAMEWVEQELLARIVSEMNQPMPDPTSAQHQPVPTPESSTVASESEEEGDADMMAAAIGLGGIQLFVDAGLPVDRHLINDLIRDVVAEKIATLLGYPKPTALPPQHRESFEEEDGQPTPPPPQSPIPTPLPTPDYTPVESETSARDSSVVATPVRTPTPSVSSLESESTPSVIKESSPAEDEKQETDKSESEIAADYTSVPTPVPTPPRAQSPIASVSTPEPSVKESEVSEAGTVISTPQPSVKTPTPPPEPSSISEPVESVPTPKTPSTPVSQLTPPKPSVHVTSSPSTMTTSTLSTPGTATTMTTEEDMSEGELIQPHVHLGQYSEGEYGVSRGIVQLAASRDLPLDPEALWDRQMLGKDDDSRNEKIRSALHGLLRRGQLGRVERRAAGDHGSRSGSETTEHSTSLASTLRDTEDIKEDSIATGTQSEGELALPKDPMAVLLNRIQQHLAPVPLTTPMTLGNGRSESEGEYPATRPLLRQVSRRGARTVTWSEGEIVGQDAIPAITPEDWSPEEVFGRVGIVSRTNVDGGHSPGELAHSSKPPQHTQASKTPSQNSSNERISEPFRRPKSRSLHQSDLISSSAEQDFSPRMRAQSRTIIQVGERKFDEQDNESAKSASSSKENVSNGGKLVANGARFPSLSNGEKQQFGSATQPGRKESGPLRVVGRQEEPQQPTRIELTIPSMDTDMNESSLASDFHFDLEHDDTGGDLSSISGGDF